jgi:mannose-1-phosphate guanylyltransferase
VLKRTDRQRATALIIAGGRGTRFWPESRINRPKPLFAVDGRQSLLAATIARLEPLIRAERIFVLVSAEHAGVFRRALKGLIAPANLIVEPSGRGTTVAIAYGAAVIARRCDDQAIVAVVPADHHIPQAKQFRQTLTEAIGLARHPDAIVVVGVTPTRPETGYGYQEIGRSLGVGFKVTRFVEKPDAAQARRMLRSGKFLWNAGMFVMRVATLKAELARHAPVLATSIDRFAKMKPAALRNVYGKLKFASFDRVVAEKSRNLIGVRARFGWDDVGSWEGLWEAQRGGANSVISGNVIALDSAGVLARGGKRLMVMLGVTDLVAVDTDDVVLIAKRSRSQEIGRALDELKRRGFGDYL